LKGRNSVRHENGDRGPRGGDGGIGRGAVIGSRLTVGRAAARSGA
jgi:hypothetical protein